MNSVIQVIKSSLDLNDVLDKLGVGRFGSYTHQIKCPFHDDSRPSARIYVREGKAREIYCWTCGKSYDVVDCVCHFLECSIAEAIKWIKANFSLPYFPDVAYEVKRKEARSFSKSKDKVGFLFSNFCGIVKGDFLNSVVDYCWSIYDEASSLKELLDWLKYSKSLVEWARKKQKLVDSIHVLEDLNDEIEIGEEYDSLVRQPEEW